MQVKALEETEKDVPPKPAAFTVGSLLISPTTIPTGSNCSVAVEVSNIGKTEGEYHVLLEVDEEVTSTVPAPPIIPVPADAQDTPRWYSDRQLITVWFFTVAAFAAVLFYIWKRLSKRV